MPEETSTAPCERHMTAQLELRIDRDLSQIDSVYAAVEGSRCAFGHMEIYRAEEGAGCHLAVSGSLDQILELDAALRRLGIALAGGRRPCMTCRARRGPDELARTGQERGDQAIGLRPGAI
jgi:hypothetical protein